MKPGAVSLTGFCRGGNLVGLALDATHVGALELRNVAAARSPDSWRVQGPSVGARLFWIMAGGGSARKSRLRDSLMTYLQRDAFSLLTVCWGGDYIRLTNDGGGAASDEEVRF
jgi:hypothetical protein